MKTTSSIDNTNHAKKKQSKLLVIDTIMPESNEPFIGKFTVLALTQKGRIRTESFVNYLKVVVLKLLI